MPRIYRLLPLTTLIVTCVGTAFAAEPVIVYDDSEVDAILEPLDVAAAQRLGLDSTAIQAAIPASKFAFDSASVWPDGLEAQVCVEGDPNLDLTKVIAAGEEAIDAVDYAGAVLVLSAVEDKLACFAPPIDGPSLARASFLRGFAHFQAGDQAAASAAFTQAAAFDPTIDWDDTYAPDGQQVFNHAVLEALRAEEVELRTVEGLPLDGLEIDGVEAAAGSLVRPGRHHLRVPTPGGGLTSIAVDVAPGRPFDLVSAAEIVRRWFGTPAEARDAVAVLAAPLAATGTDELYVLDPTSERIILVRPAEGQVLEVGASLARQGLRGGGGGGRPSAGVVMAIAGGVAAGAGLIGGLVERNNAMSILDEAVANPDQRDQLREDYGAAGDRMTVGFVIAGTGAAVLAVGIPLGVHQGRNSQAIDASVSGWWTAGDDQGRSGGIRLTGQW